MNVKDEINIVGNPTPDKFNTILNHDLRQMTRAELYALITTLRQDVITYRTLWLLEKEVVK